MRLATKGARCRTTEVPLAVAVAAALHCFARALLMWPMRHLMCLHAGSKHEPSARVMRLCDSLYNTVQEHQLKPLGNVSVHCLVLHFACTLCATCAHAKFALAIRACMCMLRTFAASLPQGCRC